MSLQNITQTLNRVKLGKAVVQGSVRECHNRSQVVIHNNPLDKAQVWQSVQNSVQ